MATKQKAKSKKVVTKSPAEKLITLGQKITGPAAARARDFLKRRPHRSFRLTSRRDYKRSFKLPGYWAFTNEVRALLWKNWRLFGSLTLVYIAASIIVTGFGAQETYSELAQLLNESSGELFSGNLGQITQAGILLWTTVQTGLSPSMTEAQSIFAGLILFFGWLAAIWLLRNTLAGHKPRLRDGLYNSGSPVLATVAVGCIITLQLLPAAIAVIVYGAAEGSQMLETGVSAMLVWASVSALTLVSIYWITSSVIALVIVTLPGMYPLHAIRSAGDLVVGRRLRVLFRLSWLLLIAVLAWAIIVIPIILLDAWVKQLLPAISWLPIVPLVIVSMSAVTLLYAASYIYLLYRRIVDDDAAPA